MKKKGIVVSVFILIIALVILFLVFKKRNSKIQENEVDENSWSAVADKYHYRPDTLRVEIPSDFSDREMIDIYIAEKGNTNKRTFLEGVYSWKTQNDNTTLGILIPSKKGIHEIIHYLPSTLNYTFLIEKSSK